MSQNEIKEIYYSKIAYGFGLFFCIIIDLIGFELIALTHSNEKWALSLHLFTKNGLLGAGLMALFSFLGWIYLQKLSDNSPALIIDDKGITINNNEPVTIRWNQIDHIEVVTRSTSGSSSKNKFIEPVLKNTGDYLNNTLKKSFKVSNKFQIKTNTDRPVSISTTFLKCSFDELRDLLETKLNEYNAKSAT